MARRTPARSKGKSKASVKGRTNVNGWAPTRTRRKASRRSDFMASCRELYAFCTRLPVIFAFGITMGICLGITAAEIDELRQATGQAHSGQIASNETPPTEASEPEAPEMDVAAGAPEPEVAEPEITEPTAPESVAPESVAPEPAAEESDPAAPETAAPETATGEPTPPPFYTEEAEPDASSEVAVPEPAPEAAVVDEPAAAPEPVPPLPVRPVPVPYESHEPDPVPAAPAIAEAAIPAPIPAPTPKPQTVSKPAPAPIAAPSAAPEPLPDLDMESAVEAPVVAGPVPANAPTWLKNAVASIDPGQHPIIAIVLDDVGVAPQDAEQALKLPGAVTLSIMTYASNAATLAKRARAKGHEIMVHMPMEPVGHSANPGPNALLVDLTEAEIRRRVVWGLTRFDGYVGINNHMGSRFTQDAPGMRIVMEELKARGLLFLDSRTIAKTVGDATAAEAGVTHVSRDVFLDNTMSVAAILRQLRDAETVALTQGYVVAIGHPHPATIAALKSWIPQARKAGFILVPLSAIVKKREGLAG